MHTQCCHVKIWRSCDVTRWRHSQFDTFLTIFGRHGPSVGCPKTLFLSEPHLLLIWGEARPVLKIYRVLSNLKVSLGFPAAIFQNGGQNGRQIPFFSSRGYVWPNTWLVICPFLGFQGQGIQIWQNRLILKIQDGGKSKMVAKMAAKIDFSQVKSIIWLLSGL